MCPLHKFIHIFKYHIDHKIIQLHYLYYLMLQHVSATLGHFQMKNYLKKHVIIYNCFKCF